MTRNRDETAFVPVGEALAPAEAAYLEHEFRKHGIEARLRAAERPGPELVVEVRARDLEACEAARRELLQPTADPAVDPMATPDSGRRRGALLAAATGAVAVLYLGRRLPGAAFRGLLALAVGVIVYLAVSAATKPPRPAGDDDRRPGA